MLEWHRICIHAINHPAFVVTLCFKFWTNENEMFEKNLEKKIIKKNWRKFIYSAQSSENVQKREVRNPDTVMLFDCFWLNVKQMKQLHDVKNQIFCLNKKKTNDQTYHRFVSSPSSRSHWLWCPTSWAWFRCIFRRIPVYTSIKVKLLIPEKLFAMNVQFTWLELMLICLSLNFLPTMPTNYPNHQ